MTAETVIAAAVGGDKQAFAQLLDGQYNRIYRFAYRWCGNVADAEDVTQIACIKLGKSISQFRGDSTFSTWLYRLVVNCAKDWQKSQTRHLAETELTEEIAAQHAGNEATVQLNQVLKQIDAMGEGFKESALLVLAEGFSHKEAATLLGVQEGTISWRIHEMRQRLAVLEWPAVVGEPR
jgi:RNA polymerase sigma-70 factor (ECF subfamily)